MIGLDHPKILIPPLQRCLDSGRLSLSGGGLFEVMTCGIYGSYENTSVAIMPVLSKFAFTGYVGTLHGGRRVGGQSEEFNFY